MQPQHRIPPSSDFNHSAPDYRPILTRRGKHLVLCQGQGGGGVRVDAQRNRAGVLSIPRDAMMEIPLSDGGYGPRREFLAPLAWDRIVKVTQGCDALTTRCGDVAKWLRRGSAKPLSSVRIRPSPPTAAGHAFIRI